MSLRWISGSLLPKRWNAEVGQKKGPRRDAPRAMEVTAYLLVGSYRVEKPDFRTPLQPHHPAIRGEPTGVPNGPLHRLSR